jgi:hypothetical protein
MRHEHGRWKNIAQPPAKSNKASQNFIISCSEFGSSPQFHSTTCQFKILTDGDRCALNLSKKHQPKPNLHTEVHRNGTEVLETCTDEYQTLVQGLIKGCREWYRPQKRGESVVLFIEVLGTKSKYLSLDLSKPEWNRNRQESWWNTMRVSMRMEPLLCKCSG